jgi:hypothetical protein
VTRYRKPILFAVFGLLAFYLVPWSMYTQSNVDDADKRTAEAKRQIDDRQAEIDAARSVNRTRLEEQRRQLADLMPPDPDLKATIDRLVELADEAGVRWEQSSVTTPVEAKVAAAPPANTSTSTTVAGGAAPAPAPGSDGAGLVSYNLGVVISGPQAAVLDYLERIRGVQRLVLVGSVQVAIDTTTPTGVAVTTPTTAAATATTAAPGGASPATTVAPRMRATLELRTYSYRGLGTPSTTAATTPSTSVAAATAARAAP